MKAVRILAAVAVGAGALVVAMPSAQAATINVTAGQSIQTAIDGASPGDTINIGSGLFRETIVVYKDDLTIIGHNTVIQPPAGNNNNWTVCITQDPSCPAVPTGNVDGVSITGVTVQKNTVGVGFLAQGVTNLTLSNDRANNNSVDGFGVFGASNTTLSSDTATGNFGGFQIGDAGATTLTGDQATGNKVWGFLISVVQDVALRNSIATSNCDGLVLFASHGSHPGGVEISNDVFGQNTKPCPDLGILPATKGAGALVFDNTGVLFTHNAVQGNGKSTSNQLTGGLIVFDPLLGSGNVFTANAFANNLPIDIRADDVDPADNAFTHNACHTSSPSGLCP
jgi:hypothetical protein